MSLDINGLDELRTQIAEMASKLDTEGAGASVTRKILESAAAPVEAQMKTNASKDPKIISGALHDAIHTGKVKKRANGGKHITIGVHRKDWDNEDYYPAYVEYGHGGPGPAPSHPYIRPAYDTTEDEAYEIIRSGLREALDKYD
jgi:phage protein, HK97 gp10 family